MFKKVLNQDSVGGPNEWSSKIQLGQIGQGRMTCWFCPRGRVSEPQTSNCSTCTRRSRVLKCARLQHSTLPLLHALHRSYPEYKWGQKSSHISNFPCIPILKLNNKKMKCIPMQSHSKQLKMIFHTSHPKTQQQAIENDNQESFQTLTESCSIVQNCVFNNFFILQVERLFVGKSSRKI